MLAVFPPDNWSTYRTHLLTLLTSTRLVSVWTRRGGDPVGYDHCYALRNQAGAMALAATVRHPESGRVMEIRTTQPGIQFYTGNFLDGQPGSGGFDQYGAFCLETQHYPDSPNQPNFPSTLLMPGQTYKQTTVHKFSVVQ